MKKQQSKSYSTIVKLEDFDPQTGSKAERFFFNNRPVVIIISALLTLFLGYQATRLDLNAGFEKMMPTNHP